jgi:TonB family protein
LKISGIVEVQASVDESGSVSGVTPKSGNPLLTKAAVGAVKGWKFKPFTDKDGKPSAAVVELSFDFH